MFCGAQGLFEGGRGCHRIDDGDETGGPPCNGAVEMIDYEQTQGKPAQRAGLLAEVLGDATWQPMFLFYMEYPLLTARASPRRGIDRVMM